MEQRREAPNVPPRARNGSGNSGSRLEDARQYRTDVDVLTPIDLKAFSATPTWRSEKKNKAYSPLAHLQRGSGAAVPRRAISVSDHVLRIKWKLVQACGAVRSVCRDIGTERYRIQPVGCIAAAKTRRRLHELANA